MNWWPPSSLKLRLALWFAAVAGGILLGLMPVVYLLIEHRLHVELERQLRIDWNLIEAHLEADPSGHIQWRRGSPATPDSPGYAGTWFDVWMGEEPLLSHWPAHSAKIVQPPRSVGERAHRFYTIELEKGSPARALEQPAQIGTHTVTLRVFRDESGLHRTLREVLIGFALGAPLAAFLAAIGGYVMAGRMLAPIGIMAEQARRITSESLGERLPNPNPHDELGQLASIVNQTLQRLQNSFEALRQFTADASHELRTPLTALHAVGEVGLRSATDEAGLRETIGSMLEEAQRLSDLVDSLLLLARVESGRSPLQIGRLHPSEILDDVRQSIEVLAQERDQTIESFADAELVALGDRVLLHQAVMNILHNAIRYSPPGKKVVLRCFRRDTQAVIEVADEGPGIAPEHQQRIFERFYRIDKARSPAEGGAGLGLAIAKLSVEQQGGSIELASEAGKGSQFRIVLQRP